ncbi:HdeD family acid-resistance protein [Shewanella sp. GXUN23E]|uniref:HdeD family acid-resistance protein n=1 Tax=Shewanella sp. GXUN23E TaxID=3422498 RepID=UPI003D7CE6BB
MMTADSLLHKAYKTSKNWGYITILLGILAIALPFAMGLAVAALFALALIAVGVVQLLAAWPGEGRGLSFRLVWAILTLVAGLYMLINPTVSLATLTLFLGSYFLVDGVANIATAFQLKPRHGWGYIAMGGVSSLILALIILVQWPVSSEFVIGILIGVKLLILGTTMVALAKSAEKQLAAAPSQPAEKEINPQD